ncbi:MAG: sialate O-acetylesterase [Fuerstiella sp.]|nr:sialate O-acetylesterase [Fuerstiella sp.]
MRYTIRLLLLIIAPCASTDAADLRFAKIFTDHCVLQREMSVPVWGWAEPDSQVMLEFAGQTKSATANRMGKWLVRLDPMKASTESRALTVTSVDEKVTLKDVLVGEVWLASGQSNMGFSIPQSTHAEEARKVIPHTQLRRFKVGSWLADEPLEDIGAEGAFQDKKWRMGDTAQWRVVDNERYGLDYISAVGAWFAHGLRVSQGVPVGLIESHFGGSMIYPWMPIETLESHPEYRRDILTVYQKQKLEWQQKYREWEADPNRNPNSPPTEPWRPACLYNGQISSFAPFAMRGVVWYQGESSQGRAESYRRLLPDMVTAWRKAFQKKDLAFLAVQLPAYGKVREWRSSPFAEMRESVSLLETMLPHTASVVSTDCGLPDEIHPPLKKPIAQRLALAARAKVYGETDLVWSGPTFRRTEFHPNGATVRFDHVGSGLVAKDGPLVGFALAGLDQQFHAATGTIVGDTVELQCDAVIEPVAVRYAWQDSPIANVWNADGLPTGTFRSDIWKLQTQAIIRDPLVLKEGGTKEKPAIFDGHGMTIDLGIEVTDHKWLEEGDIWTSQPDLLAIHGLKPRIAAQTAGLFVEGIPITIPRDIETEKQFGKERSSRCYFPSDQLEPGQMGYKDDGSLYFRWPKGVSPNVTNHPDPATAAHYRRARKKLYLPPKAGTNCVSIACSHITIRNLTVIHAGNDGFNIHGHRKGIRLENVRALSNADEGISAHETVEMQVVRAEVAWNGSAAGGVADVNDSITSYRDCIIHDNAGAAFYFSGNSHSVTDTLIFNESKDFSVQRGTEVKQERIEWRGSP